MIEVFEFALNEYLPYHYDKICRVESNYYFTGGFILFEVSVFVKELVEVFSEDERRAIRGDILMVKSFLDINCYITVKFMPTVFSDSIRYPPPFY